MNLKILCIISLASCFELAAQKENRIVNFGEFTDQEIHMEFYDADPEAEAVVLYDYGESNLVPADFDFIRHTRIKIFKKEGYKLANQLIAVRKGTGPKLSKFKAATYNLENGKLVATQLTSDGFFREDFNEWIDVIRFTMPNVKEGSIIEYSYEIGGAGLVDWVFQSTIPTLWSENRIKVISAASPLSYSFFVTYNKLITGFLVPYIYEEKKAHCDKDQCNFERTVMKDVPAFHEEPYIPALKNYLSGINYEITSIGGFRGVPINILSTWDAMALRYEEDQFFDGNVIGSTFLKKKSQLLVVGLTHPDEKVLSIVNYVRNQISWNEVYSSRAWDIKKTDENRLGNSAEVNLTLLAMLRYAGLPADPVLISTRDNGFVRREVPNSRQFNHVVVLTDLEGQKALLDVTNKYLAFNYLPESCLNGFGYISNRENPGWVNVENLKKSRISVWGEFTISENLNLIGKLKLTKTGYEAESARRKFILQGEQDYLDYVSSKHQLNIDHIVVSQLEQYNEPLLEEYEIEINDHIESKDEILFFNPNIYGRINENPFKMEQRRFPVDFKYPQEISVNLKFKVPEGYIIDELPQPKMSVLPAGNCKFIYSPSISGDWINLISQFTINTTLFATDDYLDLREFYNVMIAKQSELIILKRK